MINASIPEAAGTAALHCDELLGCSQAPMDLSKEFARFARSFTERASGQLSVLCDDRSLTAEVAETGLTSVADWFTIIGASHQHSYFSIGQFAGGMLVSVPIGVLVAQFERILGGTGEIEEDCATLPASSRRFAHQFEQRMAETLWRTVDRPGITATASGEEVEQVAPFGEGEKVWTATLVISTDKGTKPWNVRIAATQSMIGELVGSSPEPVVAGKTIGERGLEGSAIADVDVPMRAVLVDLPISVARLSNLAPGSVIPVALNRNVPLLSGEFKLAYGSIGELDDCVALELTKTFLKEQNP